MNKLITDYSENIYSQFGEDGIIHHIFYDVICEPVNKCVEFGAADGLSCSNTANLWLNKKAKALMMEIDSQIFQSLLKNINDNVLPLNTAITPENINRIIFDNGFADADLISIDVDGDDYFIFEALEYTPKTLLIEYNETIPPHLPLRPSSLGGNMGASAAALVNLAESKGYCFLGCTKANVILVQQKYFDRYFKSYKSKLEDFLLPENFVYFATDYLGRPLLTGKLGTPWGINFTHGEKVEDLTGAPYAPVESRLPGYMTGE